ncbi:MAG: UbiA-like polyprenyltransferase [Pseudomonadota bacterium]
MIKKILVFLEMIKFEHTVFALPFAFMGALLAAGGIPAWNKSVWILLAMVGARTAAMGFNRIVDLPYDSRNPRTSGRALPKGDIKTGEARLFVLFAAALFFFAAYRLNRLTLLLSPLALATVLFYSYTKRVTWLAHIFLGLALGIAPAAGWVAVKGTLDTLPLFLSAGVIFWVAGFDVIYACMDFEFDRETGLHSIPCRFGRENAFFFAALFHILAFLLFFYTGIRAGLGWIYYAGVFLTALALVLQHVFVTPRDLSKINLSFFTMNGVISITLFFATWAAL